MKIDNGLGFINTIIFTFMVGFSVQALSQALPEGEGRDEMVAACTACHGLDNITNPSKELTAEEWEFHLYDMIARGAPVYEEDIDVIRRYLIDNFAVR